MKLNILPSKSLREISKEVEFPLTDKDEKIIKKMIEHIDKSQEPNSKLRPGVGIAAIQLGYLKRMFYVNIPGSVDEERFREFLINPKVIAVGAQWAALEGGEGCLSVPETFNNTEGLVYRKNKIIIEGISYFTGEKVRVTKVGYPAIVLQHELDHLDGKLFIDHINKTNPWERKKNDLII